MEYNLLEKDGMISALKSNLELTQNRMKVQADRRTGRHFDIGDRVYLKLVTYRLQSLVNHSYQKLQPRLYGVVAYTR